MEKEGLVRAVDFLRKKKFKIATLVTDRHKQISKWVRENTPGTAHRYDIWHLAKCKFLCGFAMTIKMKYDYSFQEKG